MPVSPPTTTGTHLQPAPERQRHRAGLLMIALYKLVGALLLFALGIGALKLVHKDIDDVVWHALVEVLHRNPESRFVNFIFKKAELLNDPLLKRIGFWAFCYAGVSALEAVGLYLEKVWAEFLTVAITGSFLPLELHELFRRVTWVRVGLLAVNTAVVIYLLWVIGEKAAERARRRHAIPSEHQPQ
ncbi:MAG TPA: DUF2127 domain-containing protein [Terracidiphilus sp.]|nr:DUF2127 domain-containing protein [Terracidiphilus sp.]